MLRRLSIPVLAASSLGYLAFYIFFTGTAQYLTTPAYGIEGIHVKLMSIETQTYTGPILQLIGDGYLITVRLVPAAIGAVLAALVGVNVSILWYLYRARSLKACLLGGGAGGAGALIANLACFSYLCCGWAPSLIILGTAFTAAFGTAISAIAIALLTLNAIILAKRMNAITTPGVNANLEA
ncbi:MAG: hypothetical protein NXY59_01990 [Aigarchaeota archaeon]|nr:hypothetical protein [Candidatus Pelearchaeum maunauluense]